MLNRSLHLLLVPCLLLFLACGGSSGSAESADVVDDLQSSDLVDTSDTTGGGTLIIDSFNTKSKGEIENKSFTDIAVTSGGSQTISFTVGANTRSFLIMVRGSTTALYGVKELLDSDQKVLYRALTLGYCSVCSNRTFPGYESTAMLVPNTPGIKLKAGEYKLQLLSDSPDASMVDIEIVFYNSSEELTRGKLDLNLFFTGAGGITADNAETNSAIVQALNDMRQIMLQGGIDIDKVRYYDAPAELQNIQTSVGGDSDLAKLFRTSDGAEPGVNIFFVRRIRGALGIAGGIPGPNMIHGTGNSGVAVIWNGTDSADYLGSVMSHEVGHFLGLFHSTEYDGSHDPLTDTPPNDSSNLMYWSGDSQKSTWLIEVNNRITPHQRFVLQNNPLLHLK